MSETIAETPVETTETVEEQETVRALNALDRCDTCSAAALFLATKEGAPSDLLFCGHHARKHSVVLGKQGWTLHGDENALTLAKARRE